MEFTVKSKIKDQTCYVILDEMAGQLSSARRSLFVDLGIHKKKINDLKSRYILEKQITARQFNSLRYEIQGLLRSQKELKENQVKKYKLKRKAYLEKLESAKEKDQYFKAHQFTRKIQILDHKIKQNHENKNKPSICFGSKKLFKQQHYLKENGLDNHEAWRKVWREERNSSFFLIGSKDESFGNQSCQLLPGRLKLRLTELLFKKLKQKYIEIPIEFTYNQSLIESALISRQALSYRFIKEKGHWYVHLTLDFKGPDCMTDKSYGALGVDLNPSCIAVSQIDPYGNPIRSWQIPTPLRGKKSNQACAILGDAIAKIVEDARNERIPIVIEKLDFESKKQELRSRGMNRMLSSFSYSTFYRMISARSFKEGVELKVVNPAYTSIIGKVKFSLGYGLSTHMGASVSIARRGLKFGERLRAKTKKRLPLPARTRGKHVWSDWRRLNQKAKKKKNLLLSWQQPDCTQGDLKSSKLTRFGSLRTRKGFGNEAPKVH